MNRIEIVRTEIDTILLQQPDIDERRNGFVHLYGVTQNCTLLAIKRGLDTELCTIMGMLHDIHTYKYCYVKEHAKLGAIEAENLLTELNLFTADEIQLVRNSILNHSDKKTKHDKYSELLKDADVLQNSLYNFPMEVSHRKRFKKTLKELGLKLKKKKLKS